MQDQNHHKVFVVTIFGMKEIKLINVPIKILCAIIITVHAMLLETVESQGELVPNNNNKNNNNQVGCPTTQGRVYHIGEENMQDTSKLIQGACEIS